jgi:peptidoglycan hydrolase-like protein with peptidoglycan-binding domain
MTGLVRTLLIGAALATSFAPSAQALECHSSSIAASSRLYISKSFGAFPGSWAAWRKKVKAEIGDGWQAWRRAREPRIECDRVVDDVGKKRWQCTRTAIPCRLGSTDSQPPGGPIALCDQYPVITRKLARGDSGDQVRMLQCLLKVHGIKTDIDGNFGYDTRAAVREFQRRNDLEMDGVVGDKTAEKLSG